MKKQIFDLNIEKDEPLNWIVTVIPQTYKIIDFDERNICWSVSFCIFIVEDGGSAERYVSKQELHYESYWSFIEDSTVKETVKQKNDFVKNLLNFSEQIDEIIFKDENIIHAVTEKVRSIMNYIVISMSMNNKIVEQILTKRKDNK